LEIPSFCPDFAKDDLWEGQRWPLSMPKATF
jgi:hypothetical protein